MLSKAIKNKYSSLIRINKRNVSQIIKQFATVDPFDKMGSQSQGMNLIAGKWEKSIEMHSLPDPLTGDVMIKIPKTKIEETDALI